MNRAWFSSALLVMLVASLSVAHEFWISPGTFRPKVGEKIAVHLLVGDGFPGEVRPRDPTKLVKFVALGPKGETPIAGEDGEDPAGYATFAEAGTYVLAYRGKNSRIVLEGAKFEEYLKEKGLDEVIKARAEKGKSKAEGRELFSRCAKAIVSVGGASGAGFDKAAGLTVEIIPLKNPYAMKAGEVFEGRLLNDGKGAANVLITAVSKDDAKNVLSTRTDGGGKFSLKLDRAGVWLVNGLLMRPAPEKGDAEWESIWSSLTFDLAPGTPK